MGVAAGRGRGRTVGSLASGGETLAMEAGGCRYQFRIALLGDAAVGKTSLLRCYMRGAPGISEPELQLESAPTVGVEFYTRTVQLQAGPRVKLQLWDTAGQERFRCAVGGRWAGEGREGFGVRGFWLGRGDHGDPSESPPSVA